MIAPQTDVYLLKVPLEISDLNQLTFDNATSQYNYFSSLPKIDLGGDFTYQRKDGTIRVPALVDDILEYNYVMYRNDAYSDKWFYAYITNMEWLNDNVTLVSIKSDVWQCWQFSLQFKPVLIDREHTNDDTVGKNTYPEGLELGEMVINHGTFDFGKTTGEFFNDYWVVVDVAQIENTGEESTLHYSWEGTQHNPKPMVNGMPSGCFHLLIGVYGGNYPSVTMQEITHLYDVAGLGSSIVSMYIVPKATIPNVNYGLHLEASYTGPDSSTVIEFAQATVAVPQSSEKETDLGNVTFTTPTTLHSYEPINKKLLTYPYCYFNISNNAGCVATYHYEDFNSAVEFKLISALAPSGNIKAVPQNYKNIAAGETCLDFGVTGAKYPICGWTNDSYTNWLTQNAVNEKTQQTQATISGVRNMLQTAWMGAQSGGPAGLAIGSVLGAGGAFAEQFSLARQQHLARSQANLIPDQTNGNVNVGDLVWAYNNCRFTYMPMCIKPEYASKIDGFFNQYGYKCNEVKVPNITGRRNWNYVKTVGCYIEGDVPQADLNEIKLMFDKGITLWHNPATFADYNQNNDII